MAVLQNESSASGANAPGHTIGEGRQVGVSRGLRSGINTKTMMNQRKGERRRNFIDHVL